MSDYRPLDLIRLCWGLLGLVRPARASRLYGADPDDKIAVRTARVLGARHVAQASVLPLRAGRRAAPIGAVVDVLHVLSMLALARARPAWRRSALTSAAVSSAFALAGITGRLRPARSPRRTPAATDDSSTSPIAVFTVAESPNETRCSPLADQHEVERDRDELLGRLAQARKTGDDVAARNAAHEHAARVGARTRRILADRGAQRPRGSAGWFGGAGMTLIGVWLLVGQWALNYPFDVTGQNTALRDTGLAIVLTLAGLRLWWLARERDQHQDEGAHTTQVLVQMDEVRMNERSAGPHLTRPSRSAHRGAVALTVAVLAGIFLLSAGWIFPHVTPVDRWNEILAGALVLLAAAGARTGLRLPTSR